MWYFWKPNDKKKILYAKMPKLSSILNQSSEWHKSSSISLNWYFTKLSIQECIYMAYKHTPVTEIMTSLTGVSAHYLRWGLLKLIEWKEVWEISLTQGSIIMDPCLTAVFHTGVLFTSFSAATLCHILLVRC